MKTKKMKTEYLNSDLYKKFFSERDSAQKYGHQWWILTSAALLRQARELSLSVSLAAEQARLVYRGDARGMYKKIMADARKTLEIAGRYGLTEKKPYLIRGGKLLT